MTQINFYHLLSTPLHQALPKLMEKALSANLHCLICTPNEAVLQQLDDALWEADAASFIPHGLASDAQASAYPICLSCEEDNPNQARVLVITDGRSPASLEAYDRVLDVFDGHQPDQVEAARTRWKNYKEAGHHLAYIQQQKGGGWREMATANQPDASAA